ncbi:T3SS effector HopA1 family protein [Streptomyces crystallinus]|uniref:Cyclic nucleotide-binding domain-containing protein n=1 Tax=Streptomyces crystallinus TaxID=68191 RepID=A0ABP3RUK9_9ACTN
MTGSRLAPRLVEAARGVTVAPDRSSATVGGKRIDADSSRELRRLLSNALYESLHAGLDLEDADLPFRLRDAEFERALAAAVPHAETVLRGPVHAVGESAYVVELGGVRVRVPADRIRTEGELAPGAVVAVANTSRRPALSPGFFLVEGTRPHRSADLLRVYVHITEWTAAPGIWRTALEHLEEHAVTYRAKIISSKHLYPRRDALVVYLDSASSHAATALADALGHLPGVGGDTSVFTRRLRPGVATAWEPRDSAVGMDGLSFGQHRASVLAQALIETAEDPSALAAVLHDRLTEANIDPADPSRNLDSVEPGEEQAAPVRS